eukprot:SAG22_NODE_3245_length_1834_cov_1.074352_2_plen_470_part_00
MGYPAVVEGGERPACTDNFQIAPFELDGKLWHSVEQCFQALNFGSEELFERIRALEPTQGDDAESFGIKAIQAGRTRDPSFRADWELVKQEIMYRAVRAKFACNPDNRAELLATGRQRIQHPEEGFWGVWNTNIILRVREELRPPGERDQALLGELVRRFEQQQGGGDTTAHIGSLPSLVEMPLPGDTGSGVAGGKEAAPSETFPPLLLHVPHASTTIPESALPEFVVSAANLQTEQLRLVDWYTDELYMGGSFPRQRAVVAEVSRLVVDTERFADDAMESAASVGMGACYLQTTEGQELRQLTLERRQALLAEHYHPHHARLDRLAGACLGAHGRCVVLDCHSFPVRPLPTQTSFLDVSPEICIGTDPQHTSPELRDLVVGFFRERGYEVLVDKPFRGALIPNAFYGNDTRVQSVMVELRRDLYMDEATGEKLEGPFQRLQAVLTELRGTLEEFAARGESTQSSAAKQ